MPNHLQMRRMTKLALVDSPANQHAMTVIAKRQEPESFRARLSTLAKRMLDSVVPPEQVGTLLSLAKEAETYEEALNQPKVWEKFSALQTAVQGVMDDDGLGTDEKRTKIDAALSAFRDDILSVTKAVNPTCAECGAVMKDGACSASADHVKKSEPITEPPTPGAETMRTAQTFTDVAKANDHIGVITKEHNELQTKYDALVAKSDPLAAITKGMTPEQVAIVKADRERIAKLETAQLESGFVAKADKILKAVLSDDEEGRKAGLAVVKTLAGVATDEERATAETFITKLAAQHVEVTKELDGYEIGASGAGDQVTDEGSRDEALTKAARELMKSDKTLKTLPQAVAKALELNPELYEAGEQTRDE
jgi:hypothetical protein